MDQSRVFMLEGIGVTIRKKRSHTSRRPFPDDMSKHSSDENTGGKVVNLNQCVSWSLPVNGSDDDGSNVFASNSVSGNGTGSDNKLKKVKLKVGGVTHTIQAKPSSNGVSGTGSLTKMNQSLDSAQPQQKLISQESSDEYYSPPPEKRSGLQGIPWKDFSKSGFNLKRDDMVRLPARNQGVNSDSVRKSKRVSKRRMLDGESDEDDEIRYLEKLKTSKIAGYYKDLEAESTRNSRKGGMYENMDDYEEEEELISDDETEENKKKKKQKKDISELAIENKSKEVALTTRQRALISKDVSSPSGAGQIEFPNGLPPAPSRKQKEKLSEVEQQLKKAEAAQRRRMQNEKAARESEAEAIRRILGQDSSRKKREEKMKKRQEELAQEKAANAQMLASNTIRWILSPSGTTVIFAQDIGLPKIFDFKKCSYPPPREKCAGPFCTNPYKYRDSKSKIPLCSLQCYKAISEQMPTQKAC